MKLGIELIEVSDRVRDVQESTVEVIKRSMGELGQQQPILVRKSTTGRFVLIDGQHRLAAATRLGWVEIEAEVREFPGLSDLEVELEAKRIEIETTRACADRTLCDEILARAAYLRLVLKRRALSDLRTAEANAKEAAGNVRQARITKVPSAELIRLRSVESSAIHKKTRCGERADDIFRSVKENVSIPKNIKGITAAAEEVAKAFGMHARQVLQEQKWVDGLGARFLRKTRGTDLDNSMQLTAALKIRQRHDIVTVGKTRRPNTPVGKVLAALDDKYVYFWKFANDQLEKVARGDANSLPNWWARHKELTKEEKDDLRKLVLLEDAATAEWQWKQVRTDLLATEKGLGAVDKLLSKEVADLRLKTKLKDVRRALRIVSALRTWTEAAR